MLLETVVDLTDNYVAQAGDVTGDLWRGYTFTGWQGWSGTWPFLSEKNRLHLNTAMVEIDDTALAIKQGVIPRFGILVRRGSGVVLLPSRTKGVQGYGFKALFGPCDTEWGVAALFPVGTLAAGDTCITALSFRRYLP